MKYSREISGYRYGGSNCSHAHAFLLPVVRAELKKQYALLGGQAAKCFDLGCGNGSVGAHLASFGWQVTGVDPSIEGISEANKAYPDLQLFLGSAYEDLVTTYGQFPAVISLEVVEHVYSPREYAQTLFNLVQPGGRAIISTPYHGYFKNVALAVSGKMDAHFSALWDHGHIKFWSISTLTTLLSEVGFEEIVFHRVGRIPVLARSMIAVAKKSKS